MIVVSLILVLLSLALLIFGLADASQTLVWGSVIASLIAGILLIVSVVMTARANKRDSEFINSDFDDDQADDHYDGYHNDDEDSAHTVVFDPLAGGSGRRSARRRSAEPEEPAPPMWQETQQADHDWEATQAVSDADLDSFRRVGSNQSQATPPAAADEPNPELEFTATWKPDWADGAAAAGAGAGIAGATGSITSQGSAGAAVETAAEEYYEDPPDEPAAEVISDGDSRRLAEIDDEVLVVDGRPRYHLSDCGHLRNREVIPLYLSEAREAGFTPCGLCRPDSSLLAGQRDAAR